MTTDVIILAAGRGSRLGSLTADRPKAMMMVGGVSVIERLLVQCVEAGAKSVICVVGYFGQQIVENIEKYRVDFVWQHELNGTGGAIKLCKDKLHDSVLVVLGDIVIDPASFRAMMEGEVNCLGVRRVDNPKEFGICNIDDEGLVIDIEEKPSDPKSDMALSGIYKFDSNLWGIIDQVSMSKRGEYELTDAIKMLMLKGVKFKAREIADVSDIGTPEELFRVKGILD